MVGWGCEADLGQLLAKRAHTHTRTDRTQDIHTQANSHVPLTHAQQSMQHNCANYVACLIYRDDCRGERGPAKGLGFWQRGGMPLFVWSSRGTRTWTWTAAAGSNPQRNYSHPPTPSLLRKLQNRPANSPPLGGTPTVLSKQNISLSSFDYQNNLIYVCLRVCVSNWSSEAGKRKGKWKGKWPEVATKWQLK